MASKARSVTEDIKQTRPFASKAQEATVALLRTTDVVKRRLSKVVEAEGITLQQYNVLRILRGSQGHPLCALEIAERLIEETPGVSRLIDRLVAKDLVRRTRSVEDRRMLECFISAQGLALLERMDEVVNQADVSAMKGLSDQDIVVLNDLLDRVRAANR